MSDRSHRSDLPDHVQALIEAAIPSIDALELLIFFVRHPGVAWTASQIVATLNSTTGAPSQVTDYLQLFQSAGLVTGTEGEYRFAPTSPSITQAVRELTTAYEQRPVTLIRTVYAIADAKVINALADAFKLRKDR